MHLCQINVIEGDLCEKSYTDETENIKCIKEAT